MAKKSDLDRNLDKLFETIRPELSGPQPGDFKAEIDEELLKVETQPETEWPQPEMELPQPEWEAPQPERQAPPPGRDFTLPKSGGWSWKKSLILTVGAALVIVVLLGLAFLRNQTPDVPPTQPLIPEISGTAPAVSSAELSELTGVVSWRAPESTEFQPAQPNQVIKLSSVVRTGPNGRVRLLLSNKSIVRLGENTLVVFQTEQNVTSGNHYRLSLMRGELWIILQSGEVEVQTPSGLASVYGSFLSVAYDPRTNATRINCLEGHCSLRNSTARVDLVSGQNGQVYLPALAPDLGRMTNQDVTDWLVNNPEATLVFPVLESTYVALPSITPGPSLTPPAELPTQAPPASSTPSQTATASATPTVTKTAFILKTPGNTSTPTLTSLPSSTSLVTATSVPSQTGQPTSTGTATATVTPTVTVTQTASTGCAGVSEIPVAECNALVAFYNGTSGSTWINRTDWLLTTRPCSWYGISCGGGHVIALVMPGNMVSGHLPATLSSLSKLALLHLGNNALTGSVPSELGGLTDLTLLYLSTNQLSGPLPGSLMNLSALTAIRLGGGANTLDSATVDAALRNFLAARDANWTAEAP